MTSKVWCSLTTSDGTTTLEKEKADTGSEFIIKIKDRDLHSPLLARVGEWRLKQDVSILSTKTPEAYERVSPDRFEKTGGEEFTIRCFSDVATASADVKNPTDHALDVAVTMDFNAAGGPRRVTNTARIQAHATLQMDVTIKLEEDQHGGNRVTLFDSLSMAFGKAPPDRGTKVDSVNVVDITTTPVAGKSQKK